MAIVHATTQSFEQEVLHADKPVLVDKYIRGKEVEIDAICDGRDVFVPGIMELVERTGVHSGDSISVYPSFSISDKVKGIILQYAKKLGLGSSLWIRRTTCPSSRSTPVPPALSPS